MHQPLLSFSGGEVTPYLRHRVDFEKTASSCERMRNFLPLPYGGAVKRPGLVSLRSTGSAPSNNQRLLPFVASTGDRYLLHFSSGALRVYGPDGTLKDTVAFMAGHSWPQGPWEDGIRAIHYVQINDVAFLTHPGTFPLRVSRVSDTEWRLRFIPFTRAPMLDENTNKAKTFTVASNPVAPDWASGEGYGEDDVVFTTCEWKCTAGHTAGAGNKPGQGNDWRDYWQRMFYKEGDPVTLLADDREQVAWSYLYRSYKQGQFAYAGLAEEWIDWYPTFRCVQDHTETASSGLSSIENWEEVEGWHYAYWNVGDLVFSWEEDFVYRCIQNHTSSPSGQNRPGVAANWGDFWEIDGVFSKPVIKWYRSSQYQAGEKVSRRGRVYECLVTHQPAAANVPGQGAAWEDYWVEISRMVEGFGYGNFSPGQYFRISPERDNQDFQLDIKAGKSLGTGQSAVTEHIAVQGRWNFFTYGTWWGTFRLQRSINNGKSWNTIRSWQANGDRNIADSGEEDSPVLLRLRFTKEDGGSTENGAYDANSPPRGVLIPASEFITGYCLMDAYVSADEMTGVAKTAMLSGNTYRWAEGAFNSRDGFPRAIALHESRLVFASTARNPVSLWFSQVEDFTNFETGTDASEGIFATLALSNASPIRWLASQRRLFIGTALGEWVCGSETSDSPLTPTNFMARQYAGYGSHAMQPLIALDATFFAERRGTRLRELAYFSERESYDAADLSMVAEHLFRDGIASMAWQQTREPTLWVVTRGGALLALSYNRQQRIQAWSRHDTPPGAFADVAVIPSDDGDDEVFFLVNRTNTTLERFPQHWLAAIEGNASPVVRDTSSNLPITGELWSLPIDLSANDGTTQARRKRIHKFSLSLYRSAGGFAWNRNPAMAQRIGDGTTIATGWVDVVPDAGHEDDVQFHLIHNDAAPFILRAATVRLKVTER